MRKTCGDRAVMRCIHFYQENARVPKQVAALEQGDFPAFLKLIKESGYSSYMYLQNVKNIRNLKEKLVKTQKNLKTK